MAQPNRRQFIQYTSLSSIGILGFTTSALAKSGYGILATDQESKEMLPEFPAQDRASVKEIVGASHGRLDRVTEMVTERPALAKAVWDWGFGDWESALGAASHMARTDIAEVLIAHGARPNLFTYTILGQVDAVKSMVNSMPGVQNIHGPHGITLMRHATIALDKDGISDTHKANMQEIVDFLESEGGAADGQMSMDISEEEQKTYLGEYTFGPNEGQTFTVALNRGGFLNIRLNEAFGRTLLRVEENAFAPAGAAAVRVRFEVSGGEAIALTIHDPVPLVRATRV